MTKRKEYVTREEFERHKYNYEEHTDNLGQWMIFFAFLFSVISLLSLFVIATNGFFNNPIQGKSLFCVENETTTVYSGWNVTITDKLTVCMAGFLNGTCSIYYTPKPISIGVPDEIIDEFLREHNSQFETVTMERMVVKVPTNHCLKYEIRDAKL